MLRSIGLIIADVHEFTSIEIRYRTGETVITTRERTICSRKASGQKSISPSNLEKETAIYLLLTCWVTRRE